MKKKRIEAQREKFHTATLATDALIRKEEQMKKKKGEQRKE